MSASTETFIINTMPTSLNNKVVNPRNPFEEFMVKGLRLSEQEWLHESPFGLHLYTAQKFDDLGLEPVDTRTFIENQWDSFVFFIPRDDDKYVLTFIGSCGSRDGIVRIHCSSSTPYEIPIEHLADYTIFSYKYARENPKPRDQIMPWRQWTIPQEWREMNYD